MNSMGSAPGFISSTQQPFMFSPDLPNVVSFDLVPQLSAACSNYIQMLADDFAMWDMEFWNPLLSNDP